MKYIYPILCIALLCACVKDDDPEEYVEIGSTVPTFTVDNPGGFSGGTAGQNDEVTYKPADFTGKKSMIMFFWTQCDDCTREKPKVEYVWNALKSVPDFQLVTISRGDGESAVRDYWTDALLPWYLDPDRKAFSMFADKYVPRFYLVGSNGTVVWMAVENLETLGIGDGEALLEKIKTELDIE